MVATGLVYRDLHDDENGRPVNTSTSNTFGNTPVFNNSGKQQRDEANNSMPSSSGLVFSDLMPIPHSNPANMNEHGRANALHEEPTMSHALANSNRAQPMKGAAQIDAGPIADDVRNLGWEGVKAPAPLIGGLDNEEVWQLVRRFNKQTYHVKELTVPVPGGLDFNVADEDEFSPDKLRSGVERLYMEVLISLLGFGKHIMRLRSWKEARRTTYFASAYALAWILDLIMPLVLVTVIIMIVYPPSRAFLFPPAPLALVDGSTGGVKKPAAGVLGSHDSATGAPEHYKGEAVEAEASHFVNGIGHIALSSVAGKHPMNEPKAEDGSPSDTVPDPTALVGGAANARATAGSNSTAHKDDKAKVPMEAAMWSKMRPALHGINDVTDTFERFGNALSPVPPFPKDAARLRLAGVVAALLAVSLVTSSYIFMKGMTFGVGFGFFGDPAIQRGMVWLNRNYPHWEKLLELRNTLLKGVPTNAQLTITLLRIGEANHAPLPPPPQGQGAPPSEAADLTTDHLDSHGADMPLGASPEEVALAASHDPNHAGATKGSDIDASKSHHHGKKGARILGFFKSTVRTGVEAAMGADRLKAAAGAEHAKDRLGVISGRSKDEDASGPVDFRARYNGKKGHIYISTRATVPCLSFTTDSTVDKIGSRDRDEQLHPVWTIAVANIKELKKIGGFGWKTRLVVGWALDREVADGLEIVERSGSVWKITALPLRDELFNRLVAMGGQKWESW